MADGKSDLGVRAASAVVMLAVAGAALWLGGWVWTVFVLLIGLGVMREWSALTRGFTAPGPSRWLWVAAGMVYCGLAAATLIVMRGGIAGMLPVLAIMAAVIATDIGAYFAGRAIGGPKIAPSISPSKTWAGLGGGIVGASLALGGVLAMIANPGGMDFSRGSQDGLHDTYFVVVHAFGGLGTIVLAGALVAIIAQAGDFFESWMKRRARVKDSGNMIPGHGGLFDRVDGLLAVMFVIGLMSLAWDIF